MSVGIHYVVRRYQFPAAPRSRLGVGACRWHAGQTPPTISGAGRSHRGDCSSRRDSSREEGHSNFFWAPRQVPPGGPRVPWPWRPIFRSVDHNSGPTSRNHARKTAEGFRLSTLTATGLHRVNRAIHTGTKTDQLFTGNPQQVPPIFIRSENGDIKEF